VAPDPFVLHGRYGTTCEHFCQVVIYYMTGFGDRPGLIVLFPVLTVIFQSVTQIHDLPFLLSGLTSCFSLCLSARDLAPVSNMMDPR
jgi:hypothetical protein